MGQAAYLVCNRGAEVVDINMGCLAKKVCNGYAGSALIKDLNLAMQIIEKIGENSSVHVTLKMRSGWDAQHRHGHGPRQNPELALQRKGRLGIRAAYHRSREHSCRGQRRYCMPARCARCSHAIVREHFDGMLTHHGIHLGVLCFRKHFAWCDETMDLNPTFRRELNRLEEPDAVFAVIDAAFVEGLRALVA